MFFNDFLIMYLIIIALLFGYSIYEIVTKKTVKQFENFMWFLPFILISFRDEFFNSDTKNYYSSFLIAKEYSLQEYFFLLRFEPIWKLLTYYLGYYLEPELVFFILNILTGFLILKSIRIAKISYFSGIALIHYLSEFFLINQLAIIRNGMASAILLYIFSNIVNGNKLTYKLKFLMLINPFIHSSAIITPVVYFLRKISVLKLLLLLLLFLFLLKPMINLSMSYLPEELFASDSSPDSKEYRGFIHLFFFILLLSFELKTLVLLYEKDKILIYSFICAFILTFAFYGYPLLGRIRNQLFHLGIIFYPKIILYSTTTNVKTIRSVLYVVYVSIICIYMLNVMYLRYNIGFF